MSISSTEAVSDSHPVASPPPTPSPHSNPPFATGEVDIDELASTMEDPPLGQLTLFKSVFGVGVSLAQYIVDDPLWPLLAIAGLPCSSCLHSGSFGIEVLDDQDRLEEDHLELQDFIRRQPKFPGVVEPVPSGPRCSPAPHKVPSIPKKRKQTVRIGEAFSLKRKHSVEQDPGLDNTSDYRRVVLGLPPQAVSRPEVVEPVMPRPLAIAPFLCLHVW
ncbi:hypothetical protein EV368DRAFT_88842 [Lentinula lateritia]|nr:hypothetical protein EV368DRAFT_88842 [Lentinula lateritia]